MPGHALSNYYRILDGEDTAKYLRTKEHMVTVDLSDNEHELWSLHDSALLGEAQTVEGMSFLDLKIELAHRMLDSCNLCERKCGAKRSAGEKGHCGVIEPRISTEFIHMGEEPDLVPSYTIFFSGCTFECVFCQNWDISTSPTSGIQMSPDMVARIIEDKVASKYPSSQRLRTAHFARNVNWVGGDPTSNLPFILEVLRECSANIPQVWNSNMYLTEESLKLLHGAIDVYLTDFKYGNDKCALRLSNAPDYVKIVGRNHRLARAQAEMIVRHLVLPGHVECCSRPILNWIAKNLSDVKVNVMAQYRPAHRAKEFNEIDSPLAMSEYRRALEIANGLGLDLCD
jgi:putative pyruvate formate lyase activating enzyme